jgi:hypothetical protein
MDPYAGSIWDPGSLHKYLYGNDDPVNRIDPSGRFSLSQSTTSMAVLGEITFPFLPTIGLDAAIAPIVGVWTVYSPRERKAVLWVWYGFEGEGSLNQSLPEAGLHGEIGAFETWTWHGEIGTEKEEFAPIGLLGYDLAGSLYGYQVPDGAMLFGTTLGDIDGSSGAWGGVQRNIAPGGRPPDV